MHRTQGQGQPESVQNNAGCRRLLGGLVIVNPLRDYPVNEIYGKMVEPEFDLSDIDPSKRAEWAIARDHILMGLRGRPASVQDFIDHYCDYNQIEWANLQFECKEEVCKNCRLQYIPEDGRKIYKALVDRKFCDSSQLTKNSSLKFCNSPSKIGENVESFMADVVEIDTLACAVYVEMTSSKLPANGNNYEAIIMPFSMVFNSRCRTLEMLNEFNTAETLIFGKARERLTQNLLSLEQFDNHQRQFLSRTQFSQRRQFNPKQREAIHAIVSGLYLNCPYILFGPPGTGKTVTLVEAVRLIVEQNLENATILVCTPSNTAADNFTLELLATGAFRSDSILRIFSRSKRVKDQNEKLLQFEDSLCIRSRGSPQFGIPSKEELLGKNVLICTLNTSTYLVSGGLQGCFSHIFVDEASQADELETLIPIIGLIVPERQRSNELCTRVVLAGDPQQLGPVQTCDLLKTLSKSSSLLERLIGIDMNRRSSFHFDKRITTLLEENYRSHPTLVTIPSRLYYGGILRSSAPINERNTLCQWEGLPKKGFPLLWHSVESTDASDGRSFSNMAECEVIHQYVNKLTRSARVVQEDIGIIAPYRYQIRRLRALFGRDFPKIDIDSVERFQGSERRVIIISTVRSSGAGFLDCDKRFNTAITRPKELLIIVGNSGNMGRIRGWQNLLEYCSQNEALVFHSEGFLRQTENIGRNSFGESSEVEGKNAHQSSFPIAKKRVSRDRNGRECIGRLQKSNNTLPPYPCSSSESEGEEEKENNGEENDHFAGISDYENRRLETYQDLFQDSNKMQQLSDDDESNSRTLINDEQISIVQHNLQENSLICMARSNAFDELVQRMGLHIEANVLQGSISFTSSSSNANTLLILDPTTKEENDLVEKIRFSLYKNGRLQYEAEWPILDRWMLLPAIEGVCAHFLCS